MTPKIRHSTDSLKFLGLNLKKVDPAHKIRKIIIEKFQSFNKTSIDTNFDIK